MKFLDLFKKKKDKMSFKDKYIRTLLEMKKNKVMYLFIAPYVLIFVTFTIIPVLISMGLSFTYFNILEPPRWIGLDNYRNLFVNDEIFRVAVKNTFIFAFVTGPLSYMACLIFAWLINELPKRLRAFMTLVFYAPSISGNIYLIWTVLFSGDSYGYAHGLFLKLGIVNEPIHWFTNPRYMMGISIIVI